VDLQKSCCAKAYGKDTMKKALELRERVRTYNITITLTKIWSFGVMGGTLKCYKTIVTDNIDRYRFLKLPQLSSRTEQSKQNN